MLCLIIIIELYCFLKQRAILEISRYADCGIDLRKIIIPIWFNITWITPFVAIYLLWKIFPQYPWYYCLGIYILYYIITAAIFPIPRSIYKSVISELEQKMQNPTWRLTMASHGLETYKLNFALIDLKEKFK